MSSSDKQLPVLLKDAKESYQKKISPPSQSLSRGKTWGITSLFSKANSSLRPTTSLQAIYKAHHFRKIILLIIVVDFILISIGAYYVIKRL